MRWRAEPSRSDPITRRAIGGLFLSAIVSFFVVLIGAIYFTGHIALREELAEAVRNSVSVASVINLQSRDGKPDGAAAGTLLDTYMGLRRVDGTFVGVAVVVDGHVTYSGDHALIGRAVTPPVAPNGSPTEPVAHAIAAADAALPLTTVSTAGAAELVEVAVPITLRGGASATVLTYSTTERLRTSEAALRWQLIAYSTIVLAILLVLRVPVVMWLVRRVGRLQHERVQLLANELAVADRTRLSIARDIHDGTVQDLAGASYALDAVVRDFPVEVDAGTALLLDRSRAAVRKSVHDLRTLIVDIEPPNLTAEGLVPAIEDMCRRFADSQGVVAETALDPPGPAMHPQTASLLYRSARECLANVASHAAASRVAVVLQIGEHEVALTVEDDGTGTPSDVLDDHGDGHLGLRLLAEAVAEMSGRMSVGVGHHSGTLVLVALPVNHVQST